MSEIFELNQLLNQDSTHGWSGLESDYDDIMALDGIQEYTDFDELLDIGDSSDVLNAASQCSNAPIGRHDIESHVFEWCDDPPEITTKQFESQIELEKAKLAKENEAGLLEALQKSMDMECSSMTDLVSLSSSLNHLPTLPPSLSTGAGLSGIGCHDMVANVGEDESMLKKLLLSSSNDNYPKEIDSNNNNALLDQVSLPSLPLSNSDEPSDDKRSKKRSKKEKKTAKKPFTELLKHLDAKDTNLPKNGQSSTTRVLNMNNYMRRYGFAPASRVPSPLNDKGKNKLTKKLTVVKSNLKSVNKVQKTTQHSLKSSDALQSELPKEIEEKEISDNVIMAPDMNSLLEMLEKEPNAAEWPFSNQSEKADIETKSFKVSADKRRSVMLIEPLPNKRQRLSCDLQTPAPAKTDPATRPLCAVKPSYDHDYCHRESSRGPNDLLSLALHASGVDKNEGSNLERPNSNKVLKWEEYLQRVRSGIRSAPNSPSSSPKMVRGSARVINNFMVGQGQKLGPPQCLPVVKPQLVEPIVAAKLPKPKQTVKLQEFQEYLAKLQKPTQAANSLPITMQSGKVEAKLNKVVKAGRKVNIKTKIPPKPPAQSYIKISSGGMIHTATVTSAPQQQTTPPQPMVMIRIPTMAHGNSGNIVMQNVRQPAALPVTKVPTEQSPPGAILKELLKDPRDKYKANYKPIPAVLKPIPRVNWTKTITHSSIPPVTITTSTPAVANDTRPRQSTNQQPQSTNQQPSKQAANSSSQLNISTANTPTSAAPTFKLITSNKGGVETKSLILSGVTGQLKEILTLLAQQQNNGGRPDPSSTNNTQQQKTFQQLLAAISNLNSSQPESSKTTTTNVTTASTTPVVAVNKKVVLKKQTNVPSPLSLIHEIKQNMNKKPLSLKKKVEGTQPMYVYTVPSTKSEIKQQTKSIITPGGAVMTTSNGEVLRQKSAANAPPVSANSAVTGTGLGANNANAKTPGSQSTKVTVFVDSSSNALKKIAQSHAGSSKPLGIQHSTYTTPVKTTTIIAIPPNRVKPSHSIKPSISVRTDQQIPSVLTETNFKVPSVKIKPGNVLKTPSCDAEVSSTVNWVCDKVAKEVGGVLDLKSRSVVATSGSGSSKSGISTIPNKTHEKGLQPTSSVAPTKDDPKSDLGSKEEDIYSGLLDEVSLREEEVEIDIMEDYDEYYNKLPSYLYSGKLVTGGSEMLTESLIQNEIVYDKVPHYLSSGKIDTGNSMDCASKLKQTPGGNLINIDDTFYSRLPSYFSYGRQHIVDTVTEPPPPHGETVTPNSIKKVENERKRRRSYRKKRQKRRKHKKQRKSQRGSSSHRHERRAYDYDTKISSYLLSGRQPDRGASEHSFSSSDDSYYSDVERHPRSSSSYRRSYRRSYTPPLLSPRRERSLSLTSYSSRSPSPRRDWRSERSEDGGYREASKDRYDDVGPNYSSSDMDDYSSVRSHREKRSCSPDYRPRSKKDDKDTELKNKAIQERRVMYVGGISETTLKSDLRKRFQSFGQIDDVTLHFRRGKDSYAFVTFRYACDTFSAIEKGNGSNDANYVLCFGGRRQFCQAEYADLDNLTEEPMTSGGKHSGDSELDFDALLKQAMRR